MSPERYHPNEPPDQKDTRSWVRKLTDPPLQWTTEKIHHVFPEITADQVTIAGGLGVAAGSLMMMQQSPMTEAGSPRQMSPYIILCAGLIADSVDGKMARLNGTYGKGNGALYDAVTDRTNNAFLAMTRMYQAHQNNSPVGEVLAFTSGMSGLLPSWYRAQIEEKGLETNEGGNRWWDFFGTHAGRSILQATAIGLPVVLEQPRVERFINNHLPVSATALRNVPYQVISDAITTAVSAKVSYDRFKEAQQPMPDEPLSNEQKQKMVSAQKKMGPYMALMGINLGAMMGTAYMLHQEDIHQYMDQLLHSFKK